MADNTTTYTAIIDTQVKGAEEVGDLGDKAEETAGAFVKLQLQIRKTQKDLQEAAAAGDKVKFNKLRAQLDDLEDGLEKVQFQSKQFEDQLSALPGPAGQAGGAIKGIGDAFKMMLANPVVAVIAAIAGALILMKKSLESTAEGQKTLNRISQAFSSILGPILATVEKVAVPLFNGFAFVLEKVGKAFAFVAEKMGISSAKIKEATLSVDEVQQKTNEAEKKRQEELTKKQEEQAKKRAENAAKAAEKRKKQEEEAAKNLADANKVLTEAYVATLDQRDQDIYNAGLKQNERLLALEKAGIKDKSSVLEQGRLEVAAINKKYDDEELKKKEEAAKEKAEKDKEAADKEKEKVDKKREDDLLGVDTQLEFDAMTFDQRRALINEKEQILLSEKDLTENQKTAIAKGAADQRKQIDMAELDAKAELQNAQLDLVGQFGSFLQQIAGKNKKLAIAGIVVEQAAAIGKIVANTAVANAKAAAAFPLTVGQPWVTINTISAALGIASTIAGAAKSIQQINSSDNATSASSGGATLPPAPNAPTIAGTPSPTIGGTQAASPGAQIAGTLAATSGKPMKAYVVAGDVSSQQALDRRTSNAATFGGY
jgi:myosin heavy subunit